MEKIEVTEINNMKQEESKDIVIFNSGRIVSRLTKLKLIDEYQFILIPIFLGNGKTLYKSDEAKLKLKFLESKSFDSGNMILRYEGEKN